MLVSTDHGRKLLTGISDMELKPVEIKVHRAAKALLVTETFASKGLWIPGFFRYGCISVMVTIPKPLLAQKKLTVGCMNIALIGLLVMGILS